MDPVLASVVAGVASSLATEVAKTGWQSGIGWISRYLGDHGAEVQRRAQENTVAFLCDLAKRIDEIEQQQSRVDGGGPDDLHWRLQEPDFAATLESSVRSAARTNNPDKHALLADLVSTRLTTSADSVNALAASAAVEVIPRLASKHLDALGVLTLVDRIYPEDADKSEFSGLSAWDYLSWYERHLSKHHLENPVGYWDWVHLQSLGCTVLNFNAHRDLEGVLRSRRDYAQWDDAFRWLASESVTGRLLVRWWDAHLHRVQLTPMGFHIGVSVHQLRTGARVIGGL